MIDKIFNVLKNDADFNDNFDEDHLLSVAKVVNQNIDDYLLDKEYLDISWARIGDKILNMDEVWGLAVTF